MRQTTWLITLPILILIGAVSVGWILMPWFVNYQIAANVALSPDVNPELYAAWIQPPMPIYFKVHLFNVTNPGEVQKGSLPKLSEIGPYVFVENRTKVDLVTDDVEDTVTYKEYITYRFHEELSGGLSLKDVITVINVPFVGAALKITYEFPWPMNDIGKTILVQNQEPLFLDRTVGQVLFEGWNVPFLQKIDDELGVSVIPNNTFSYFMGENDTKKGPFTVSRGVKDKSMYGVVLKYKGKDKLDTWAESSTCNEIRGTDGTLFQPFVTKNTTLRFFNPNMCHSVYATFQGESEVEGVETLRFSAPKRMIADPRESAETRCFCVFIDSEPDKCLKQGAFDMGPCREGEPPVAISPPHFLDAYPEFLEKSGLSPPNREKHGAYFDIEPTTGVVLQGSSKLQVNLILKPVKGIRLLSKVPTMLFPLMWADEYAQVDDGSLERLKSVLFMLWLIDIISKWILLGIALLFGFILMMISLRLRFQANSKRKPIPLPIPTGFLNVGKDGSNHYENGYGFNLRHDETYASQSVPLKQSEK